MRGYYCSVASVFVLAVAPAFATNLYIDPTFASSITSDPNAAIIESTINTAIQTYENLFSNPITVNIQFQEMGSGLGENNTTVYSIPYSTGDTTGFYTAYSDNAADNNDPAAQAALAAGVVPNQSNNPVTGSSTIGVKTADIKALGINCIGGCPSGLPGGYDGIISLNTSITTPGSSGSSLDYSLLATVEHEIDEVLGLGSSLGQSFQTSAPLVEDLFRYSSIAGIRSYTTNASAIAYFSIDGSTDLAQFDNQNDGGDWGDWQSNPLPPGLNPQVQDAFATPHSTPTLGINEITALEAIGYDATTPESSTFFLVGTALLALGLLRRRSSRRR